MKSSVLVVGGSLVGLSVALATNRQGSHVTVLERSGGGTVSGGGFRTVAALVVGGEGVVVGGIFAGNHDGSSVDAVFKGVEAGSGLALGGAGSGRFLGVGAICGDLSWSSHDYDLARGFGGICGAGRQVVEGERKKEKMFGKRALSPRDVCSPIQRPKTRSATDFTHTAVGATPPPACSHPATMLTDCAGSGTRGPARTRTPHLLSTSFLN